MIHTDSLHTSDGVRLNLLRAGPPGRADSRKTPVILIPGWCMPAAIWRETLLALAPSREVIALDPRGQGKSEIPAGGFHIDRRADDIAQCIEHCRQRRSAQGADLQQTVLLAGWSLGALEALHYVHRHGEAHIAALALIDSSVGEDPAMPAAVEFRAALAVDRRTAMDRFVRGMFVCARPEAEIADLTEQAMRMPLAGSLALFPSHLAREHWRGIARALQAPLLYAATSEYGAQAANLKKARPATQVEIFADAGHALFADAPERFNSLLAAFAASVDSAQ